MKWGRLVLGRRGEAEHLGRRGLVEARRDPAGANRLQKARCAQAVGVARVLGLVEGNADVALCGQVVDLIWPDRLHQSIESARVGHVAVVQEKLRAFGMRWIGVLQMVDAAAVQSGRASYHAVDL